MKKLGKISVQWYWNQSMVELELESTEPKELTEFPKSILKIRRGLNQLIKNPRKETQSRDEKRSPSFLCETAEIEAASNPAKKLPSEVK